MLALEQDQDSSFRLAEDGRLLWRDQPVARLAAGDTALTPRIETLASDFLDGAQRERIRKRLAAWLSRHLENRLRPLFRLAAAALPALARGVAFQLVEALGCLPRDRATTHAALSRGEKKQLAALGVAFGEESLYLPGLFSPRATRCARCSGRCGAASRRRRARRPACWRARLAGDERGGLLARHRLPPAATRQRGAGDPRRRARARRRAGPPPGPAGRLRGDAATGDRPTASTAPEFAAAVCLGFERGEEGGIVTFQPRVARPPQRPKQPRPRPPAAPRRDDPASPFAKLGELRLRR